MTTSKPHLVVLLVDDSAADRTLTRRSLEDSGFPVELRTVEDGQEALDYLRRRGSYTDPALSPRPAVVLLDLNMPGMDGDELLGHIRSDPKLRSLPVVVLTGSELESDVQSSYDRGANAYMVKPVGGEGFRTAIEGFLEFWVRNEHLRRPRLHADDEEARSPWS